MIYPTSEYTYVDENAQNFEPTSCIQHIYTDNNELNPDENIYDTNQYQPVVVDGSQPL